MSATVSKITQLAARKASGPFTQRFTAGWDALVVYFVRRAATLRLHELDDRALLDIGLDRTQIEAAVHGLVLHSGQGRTS